MLKVVPMSPALMGSVIVVVTLTTTLKLSRHREAKTETKKEKKRNKSDTKGKNTVNHNDIVISSIEQIGGAAEDRKSLTYAVQGHGE